MTCTYSLCGIQLILCWRYCKCDWIYLPTGYAGGHDIHVGSVSGMNPTIDHVAASVLHFISNRVDASFNNSRSLGFSVEAWVIATILRAGVLILRSCMNSNRWHFTHSVKFLAAVFLRAGLTYRNTQSLDRMDGRAKRIQLDAALNFAAQIDDENTDKLSSAPSKERFLFFFKI
jgi:hypothetical protein